MQFQLTSFWNGVHAPLSERTSISLESGSSLGIEVDAPWSGDPAPSGPPGSKPQLWEHEVVEVFFFGNNEHYLEIELGPHGHYLVIELEGRRLPLRSGMAIDYRVQRSGDRWRGHAEVPLEYLPSPLRGLNAHAIRGVAAQRRYLSLVPGSGEAPDFHRPQEIRPLAPGELQ